MNFVLKMQKSKTSDIARAVRRLLDRFGAIVVGKSTDTHDIRNILEERRKNPEDAPMRPQALDTGFHDIDQEKREGEG